MKRKISIFFLSALCALSIAGCTPVGPDDAADGVYSTQTPMSSLEYANYMNKQIVVFINQILSRLISIEGTNGYTYENELEMAEESLDIMEETLNEVIVTMPSTGRETDRETTIQAMQSAVEHMSSYTETVRSGGNTASYMDVFQADFNALSGLANLYNE